MEEILSRLTKLKGTKRPAKRAGRGYGSGKGGHTTGRGAKGQKSRAKIPLWFEGGQTPLVRKTPYIKGFTNYTHADVYPLNLDRISKLFSDQSKINPDLLFKSGILKKGKYDRVKILGRGKLTKKIKFEGFVYSDLAKKKIERSGGTAN
ncbi:50S ribosomal protein L15 [candidate division WWE3 bacterium RIFCSPLOWO2_01_FULL_39_13]|uniref:Large ribosomal subunit protein uL15 n=1 Tax=candidate division WWE3 bacterium RIFCSPLOWO2_01_FULL_39_13 TaxID=1802624 RepID=A0A1F4V532_UNCKA|nr:MAG: 50S ribosomal protein L15 [candidate division WWE3 bacterium RIFCSPLOWO2_01_FULL_39_13]